MSDRVQVERAVRRYLSQPVTDYALLISGPWGCGKTHFWKTEIAAAAKAAKLTPLYVSLYGLEKASDIDRLMLFAQFPVLKNGMLELVGKLTNSALDYFGIAVPTDGLKVDLKDKVLCFDDLERTSAEVSDVLGHINSLVEHDKRKVIVLANESEIHDEDYDKVKEKLFRFVYQFDARLEGIPDSWISADEQSGPMFNFLVSKKLVMIELFSASNSNNLRSLGAAIDNFKIVWSESGGHKNKYVDVWDAVLRAVFGVTLELKKDGKSPNKLRSLFQESSFDWARLMGTKSGGQEEDYAAKVERKYFSGQRVSPTNFQSVFDFVVSGVFDRSKFAAEVDRAVNVLEGVGTDLDEKFATRYWDLTDEQFESISAKRIEDLRAGRYVRPVELLSLARLLFPLAKQKLVKASSAELEKTFAVAIKRLRESGKAVPSGVSAHLSSMAFPDLKDPRYKRVKSALESLDLEVERSARRGSIVGQVEKLGVKTKDVLHELIEGPDGLARYPVFAEVSSQQVADQVAAMKPGDVIAFRNFLENRYAGAGVSALFGSELENLKKLEGLLRKLPRKPKKLSAHARDVLIATLKKVCDHIASDAASIAARTPAP